MGFDFKAAATEAVVDSFIRNGREKAKLNTLAKAYPNGLTVIAGDITHAIDENGNIKEFSLVVFAEEKDKYVNGGASFTKIIKSFLSSFDGDAEKMSAELEASGGVKVKVEKKELDNGNNFTVVTVI